MTKSKPAAKALPVKGDGPVLLFTLVKRYSCIKITTRQPNRLMMFGYGMFLANVKPGDVAAGPGVIEALCAQPERPGLMGMDFWPDKRIGFCATVIPLHEISVPKGAKPWIRKFVTA